MIRAFTEIEQDRWKNARINFSSAEGSGTTVTITVSNDPAFYLPVETRKTVAVIRIPYGGREIGEQMNRAGIDR